MYYHEVDRSPINGIKFCRRVILFFVLLEVLQLIPEWWPSGIEKVRVGLQTSMQEQVCGAQDLGFWLLARYLAAYYVLRQYVYSILYLWMHQTKLQCNVKKTWETSSQNVAYHEHPRTGTAKHKCFDQQNWNTWK